MTYIICSSGMVFLLPMTHMQSKSRSDPLGILELDISHLTEIVRSLGAGIHYFRSGPKTATPVGTPGV